MVRKVGAMVCVGTPMIAAAWAMPVRGAEALRGEWRVTAIDGQPAPTGRDVTLVFGEDGRISGGGPCNRFRVSYRVTEDQLTFSPVIATQMACEKKRMRQEQAFFEVLGGVVAYSVRRGTSLARPSLALRTKYGREIVAKRPG